MLRFENTVPEATLFLLEFGHYPEDLAELQCRDWALFSSLSWWPYLWLDLCLQAISYLRPLLTGTSGKKSYFPARPVLGFLMYPESCLPAGQFLPGGFVSHAAESSCQLWASASQSSCPSLRFIRYISYLPSYLRWQFYRMFYCCITMSQSL